MAPPAFHRPRAVAGTRPRCGAIAQSGQTDCAEHAVGRHHYDQAHDRRQRTDTVRDMSRYFGRVIVMPNLVPPVIDTAMAIAYQQRIPLIRLIEGVGGSVKTNRSFHSERPLAPSFESHSPAHPRPAHEVRSLSRIDDCPSPASMPVSWRSRRE